MLPRVLTITCALVLLGACVPAEESNDKVKRYDPEENVMGEIQAGGVMRIGIPTDRPPFAIVEPGQEPRGFLVDLGTLAAEALGVEPEFVPAPNDDLLDLVYGWTTPITGPTGGGAAECTGETSEADLVFPLVPITEELITTYTFTDPFWVGHTRSLVSIGRSMGTTGAEVARGPDVELLARAYEDPRVKVGGEEQSTEGYGAASRCGTTTFGAVMSQVINEADAEGNWTRSYETWLADLFVEPAPDEVPIMTVEDAAALYPTEFD